MKKIILYFMSISLFALGNSQCAELEKVTTNLKGLVSLQYDEEDKSDLPNFKYKIDSSKVDFQEYQKKIRENIEINDKYVCFDLEKLQTNIKDLQEKISLGEKYLTASTEEKVHGTDSRLPAESSQFLHTGKMKMHYRVDDEKIKVRGGTGILISENIVLTAGHCLYNHDSKLFPEFIEFLPSLAGDNKPHIAHVRKLIVHPKFYGAPSKNADITKTTDIGLFLIDTPRQGLGPLPQISILNLEKNHKITIAGYPGDKSDEMGNGNRGQFMWYAESNDKKKVELMEVPSGKRFKHLIDTYNGQSGAGMIYTDIEDGNLYVCGIHTGGNSIYNYGIYIDEELKQKIESWSTILLS